MSENIKFIHDFFHKYQNGIHTLYTKYSKKISKEDFLENLEDYLLDNVKNYLVEDIDNILFYNSNQFAKTYSSFSKKNYICPACLFHNKINILSGSKILDCNQCKQQLKQCKEEKYIRLYRYFSYHYKAGYRCNGCNRFIADNKSKNIICPYPDCSFIGDPSDLKKMHHPILQNVAPPPPISQVENKLLNNKALLLNKIVEKQSNQLAFSTSAFTVTHKLFVYQAFKELLNQFPDQMTDYLLGNSRSGGFQHKIFQKYISLLENSFPIQIRKNRKFIIINNLLDKNLCLFDGISVFEAVVQNQTINNNTSEYYIGGRCATYSKPYYIGKVLSIINNDTKESIIHLLKEYSFNKIKINVPDNTVVQVTHLRVPPHYQMGGMVYVNRIRKAIIDEAKTYE
jgi:hypothetical protein